MPELKILNAERFIRPVEEIDLDVSLVSRRPKRSKLELQMPHASAEKLRLCQNDVVAFL